MIKISVVIPTFQRPLLLRRCLSALINQTFPREDFEVLIVHDGPDEVISLIVKDMLPLNEHFIFVSTTVRHGPAAARNSGWRKAKGELIAFTDDDTIPDARWLEKIWQRYSNRTSPVAFTGKTIVPLPDEPTDYQKNTAGLETAEFITANCCCTKSALEKTGGFDERFSMAWREDSDLHFKLIHHHIPIEHITDAIVIHPVRQAEWGISIAEQKKGMFNALLYKKFHRLYRSKIQRSPAWNYYWMLTAIVILIIALSQSIMWLAAFALLTWLLMMVRFIRKRLKATSKNPRHVTEMIITSPCIPFVSIYWQLYGAWKYRVLFM